MGILRKWLARKGTVGGTARWAAEAFGLILKQNPHLMRHEVFQAMVSVRFSILPDPHQELEVLRELPRVGGLRDLVRLILTVEAGLAENEPTAIVDFIEVIDEELRAAGLAGDVISGQSVIEVTSHWVGTLYLKMRENHLDQLTTFKAIVEQFTEDAEAREFLDTRIEKIEGVASLVIGIGRMIGAIDEINLETAGQVIFKELRLLGLSREAITGPAATQQLEDDIRSELLDRFMENIRSRHGVS